MQNVKFICSAPEAIIMCNSRKDAVCMVRNGMFKKYGNVVIALNNGEQFNLHSQRGKEYFGIGG